MIKCPKCKMTSKTISTRNQDISIVRWHKCENCGFSFTSTQTIDFKYSNQIDEQYINSLISSTEFKTAAECLNKAFNFNTANLDYTEWEYVNGQIKSHVFNHKYSDESYKFILDVNVNKPNVYGLIYLTDFKSLKLIGQIKYTNDIWDFILDIATINKINNDLMKGE